MLLKAETYILAVTNFLTGYLTLLIVKLYKDKYVNIWNVMGYIFTVLFRYLEVLKMKSSKRISLIIVYVILLLAACSNSNDVETKETASESIGGDKMDMLDGYWEGAIQVPDQPLPIIVEFAEESGKLSIPVQGLHDYPLSKVELNQSELFFDMNLQGQRISFDGELKQEEITGTFTQQGQSFPFVLTKGIKKDDELEAGEGELVEVNVEGGVMQGKVQIPDEAGPFPVAIIIAGSGPTDKDGNSTAIPGKNNSLKMLAEALATEGVASIRYDKRGIGDNISLSGNEEDLRFDDYIDDAAAWIKYAQNDGSFSNVSVIGHSEGSLIGMIASEREDADAFVSIAGAGKPVDEVLISQLETQLSGDLLEESEDILAELKQGETVQNVSPELQSVFRPSVQPYMISWLEYDPQQEIAKLKSPVLIINGSRDLQVPVSDAESLHHANQDSELLIIEDMNHVLKAAPADHDGNVATYSQPDLSLAEGLMDPIIRLLEK